MRIRRNDVYNTIINVSYFVLMFASSIFFPLDNSPSWLRVAAYANPLTWHTDILRYFTVGAGDRHRAAGVRRVRVFAAPSFIVGVRSPPAPRGEPRLSGAR
ncbi:MAG: ABC transporter permease [Ignavibacteria bacterium]|nr:ABC transporter permease [Ignavibacteria bacterium]